MTKNNTTTHGPERWTAHHDGIAWRVVSGGRHIAAVYNAGSYERSETVAQLIASIPDLVMALEGARETIKYLHAMLGNNTGSGEIMLDIITDTLNSIPHRNSVL